MKGTRCREISVMKSLQSIRPLRRGAASIALVVVLIIVEFAIIAMVLGGARDQDLSVARLSSVQAFFAAEAGINMAIREAVDDTDHDGNGVVGGIATTSDTIAALNGASVAVTPSFVALEVTLTSLGEQHSARHRFQTKLQLATTETTLSWLYGVAVSANVKLWGNSRIDAFDSTSGTYSMWTNYSDSASVSTNAIGNDQVHLTGSSRIIGDVNVGPSGNHVAVIETTGTATVTGSRDALTDPLPVPSISVPESLPVSLGNSSFPTWGSGSLSAGTYHYNNFSVSDSYTLTINGDVIIYCDGNFTQSNSGTINLAAGATLTAYAQRFQFIGNSRLNMTNPPTPSRVFLYQLGSSSFRVDNSAAVAAAVVAPNAEVWIPNNGRLFGVVQAASIFLDNSGKFTQDLGFSGGSSVDDDNATSAMMITGWNSIQPQ
jgi:hypothetical protein